MTNVTEIQSAMDRRIERMERKAVEKQGSGGGGNPPDNATMEARVANVEQFAFDANARLSSMDVKLNTIETEVKQFKWWIVGQIAALFLAVLGTSIAIQQMTVATFQGAAQVAKDAAPATPAAQPPIIINVPAPAASR